MTASGATGDVKFAQNGAAPNGRVVAFKLVDDNGKVSLEPAWQSRDLTSPLAPIVVDGMVFAVSSGEYRGGPASLSAAQRAQRSVPAVLHVLDAATGRTLWSSGTKITSFARGGLVRRRWSGVSGHLRQSPVCVRHSAGTLSRHRDHDRQVADPGRHRQQRRRASPRAVLGAAFVHAPWPPAPAASGRPLRLRRAPRRDQRAVVFLHDECRQRTRDAGGRGAELRASADRPASAAEGRRRRRRRSLAWRGDDGAREGLEPALQVLRQHGTDPASHAPARRACAEGWTPRQARGVLLSAAVQPDRQQLSAHLHGTRARHDERPGAPLPRKLE